MNTEGDAMQNRISDIAGIPDKRNHEPALIGRILDELLAQYERQFPNLHITLVETAATAA
jgi:hypothetical protein